MARILVVASHPDDEVLGCGGTIFRRIQQGDQVYCLILGEGISSRFEKRELAKQKMLQELQRSQKKVSDFVGFEKSWLCGFPDNRFDDVNLLEVIKKIEKIKREADPEVIYTHFENDLNIDHRITFQAVLTACRPLPGERVREIYSFETPSSTEWASSFSPGNSFRPNVYVDVTSTIEKKIQAMELYSNEIKQYPHPRSSKGLKIISQRWGSCCGCECAEAFILIRKVEREGCRY